MENEKFSRTHEYRKPKGKEIVEIFIYGSFDQPHPEWLIIHF